MRDAALELKLFQILTQLSLTVITSLIGIAPVVVFFINSSDAGPLAIETIAANGKTDALFFQRIFWASLEGAAAIAPVLGGGLAALQAMAESTGLPFTLVLLAACYAVVRGLMDEPR